MSFIGAKPTAVPLTASDITDGIITSAKITDGTVAQADITNQAINEAKMQISNDPTNGYFLSAQSGNTGGLTWAGVTAESNTPSFYAYGSGHTTVGHATVNRIANQTEVFDNGGCYNHTSSTVTLNGLSCPDFRFTPNVAGLYFFVGAIRMNTSNFDVGLVNNLGSTGGTETYSSLIYGTDIANHTIMVSGYSLMNGTGNNMVLTAYQESGGSITTHNSIFTTYFGGFLVKKS